MHPIDHYNILLRARRKLLGWVGEVSAEQYAREFPFGLKSVRATLIHLANAEWLHAKLVRGEEVMDRPFSADSHPDFASLPGAWQALEPDTRRWLESETDWQRRIETTVRRSDGTVVRIAATPETLAFQFFYHEVHHRSQVMAMLRQMGIAAEGLDFNRYAFEWTELGRA